MKRFNGTVVQQLVNVKSIVIMMLIVAAFLGVACSGKSHATSTDVGGKGREIVKEDVGGPKGQEIRFSVSNEQPAILILEVGEKSSSGSQMITTLNDVGGRSSTGTLQVYTLKEDVGGKGINQNFSVRIPTSYLTLDVGGGKTVSTTKNALADVGGRSTILTGNLYLAIYSTNDVGGGRDIQIVRKHAYTPQKDVGGKEIKNLRGVIPKTDFS